MEIIGAILLLFIFSIPQLTIFLLLLYIALRLLQLLCYGLAWVSLRLSRVFEGRQPAIVAPASAQGGSKTSTEYIETAG